MSGRRLLLLLLLALVVEVAVFRLLHRDLLWLNQPVAELQAAPADAVTAGVREVLAREHLTRHHLETVLEATARPDMRAEHLQALARLLELAPDDTGVRLRFAEAQRADGHLAEAGALYAPLADDIAAGTAAVRQARIGLARVARDAGDWATADARFRAAADLTPLEGDLLREHFWVVARVDRERALSMAATVFPGEARWPRERGERLLRDGRAVDAAEAFASAARMADGTLHDHAMQAVALERAGDPAAAQRAWRQVPDAIRRARADWWAADLRTRTAVGLSAAQLPELVDFVAQHPDDLTLRAVAVEALAAAGAPDRALALLRPLTTAPSDITWRRREGELAVAAGDLARAREAFRVVDASPRATTADRWRYLETGATALTPDALLSRLDALRRFDTPCADRSLAVADMADTDAVFAWVSAQRAASCAVPERLALRAARWLVTQQRAADAEAVLARAMAATSTPTDAVLLAYADRRVAAGDVAGADALLARRLDARGTQASFALVAARAWTLAGMGRPDEGWQLVRGALETQPLTPEAHADWAGLALAADAREEAARLARQALGSPRDAAARQVLASLAQRAGQQRVAYDWLAPVAAQIDTTVAARSWLDAVAGVRGPQAALDAAARLPAHTRDAVDVLSRLARWASAAAHHEEAARHAARVAARDPAAAHVLALEMDVAAGRPSAVVTRLAGEAPATLSEPVLRILVTAALDARAWGLAARALDEWSARGLDRDWWLMKTAEGTLGAEGRLPADLLTALEARVAEAPSDELTIRIAQAHAAQRRVSRALAVLGWPSLDARTPLAVREAAVGILSAAGRPHEALALLPPNQPSPPSLQAARARALVAVDRPEEARAVLQQLPPHQRRADDWGLLARLTPEAGPTAAVLEQALARWSDVAPLWAALAAARQRLGDADAARDAARRALALDVRLVEGWQVHLALPPADAAARAADLERAARLFDGQPAVLVTLAEAALTTTPDAGTLASVARWIDALSDGADPGRLLRLRTRLAVATGDWATAIDVVAMARGREPNDLVLEHLDAQLHAWSGRHDVAATRYARYLERAPGHAEAWREYGRLLSWMQQVHPSQEAYMRAARLTPRPAIGAEQRTKAALARQAWREAATEAASWLALEPESLDARMDRALALDRSGARAAAAPLFASLATADALPQDLRRAAAGYARAHRPGGHAGVLVDASAGFGNQQLLEQRLVVAGASDHVGLGGRTALVAEVGRGTLEGGDARWSLTQVRAGVDTPVGTAWTASGQASVGVLGASGASGGAGAALAADTPAALTLRAGLDGRPADGLAVAAAIEHRPFWENAATVAAGLHATGGAGAIQWTPSARWVLRASASAHRLGDGNRRHEASGALAWRASRGARDYELRSTTLLFGYARPQATYFAPGRFVRTDVEGEVRHWFGRPRVDGERGPFVAAGLGLGVDSRAARYGLGLARVTVPVQGAWAVVGEARWVQSPVYRSSRVTVGLQLGGRP